MTPLPHRRVNSTAYAQHPPPLAPPLPASDLGRALRRRAARRRRSHMRRSRGGRPLASGRSRAALASGHRSRAWRRRRLVEGTDASNADPHLGFASQGKGGRLDVGTVRGYDAGGRSSARFAEQRASSTNHEPPTPPQTPPTKKGGPASMWQVRPKAARARRESEPGAGCTAERVTCRSAAEWSRHGGTGAYRPSCQSGRRLRLHRWS